MPYTEVYEAPQVLTVIGGQPVYFTYKYDNINDPSNYWYSFVADSNDDQFDVRDLPGYQAPLDTGREYHVIVIAQAVHEGHLDLPDTIKRVTVTVTYEVDGRVYPDELKNETQHVLSRYRNEHGFTLIDTEATVSIVSVSEKLEEEGG